jgi:hypothetical protein
VELKVRESVNTRVDNLKTTIEEVISTHSVGNLWERSLFTVSLKQVSDTDVTTDELQNLRNNERLCSDFESATLDRFWCKLF